MKYHITCNTDDNFIQHCVAMLCSLCDNNKDIELCIHVLHSITEENKAIITSCLKQFGHAEVLFHEVEVSKLDGLKLSEFKNEWPVTVYYRILLQSLISDEVDKILYLDCDTIVLDSIKPLFDLDLNGYALAACKDASLCGSVHREQLNLQLSDCTFCSGVMMINLAYWREFNAQQKLIDFSCREKKVFFPDQDALNYVFRNQWFILPYKWNYTAMSIAPIDHVQRDFDPFEYAFSPRIVHYAGLLKPWQDINFPSKDYYTKYLKLSGYPSPKVFPISIAMRLNGYKMVLRYYLNRYVRPLVPDIIEVVLKDVIRLFEFFITVIFKPKSIKRLMLKYWLRKYK